jgi:hypothetical protein
VEGAGSIDRHYVDAALAGRVNSCGFLAKNAQTPSADANFPRLLAVADSSLVEIHSPTALDTIVRMANTMTKLRPLTTYVAFSSHFPILQVNNRYLIKNTTLAWHSQMSTYLPAVAHTLSFTL